MEQVDFDGINNYQIVDTPFLISSERIAGVVCRPTLGNIENQEEKRSGAERRRG